MASMQGQCPDTHEVCQAVSQMTGSVTLGRFSEWFMGVPLALFVIIAGGLFTRWLMLRAIARVVRHAERGMLPDRLTPVGRTPTPGDQQAMARRVQRAGAIGSLLSSAVSGLMIGLVIVMVLAELGVDVAPILASAGIVGVALGFGAQSLVKDFLSGIFMIVEDQYGVGDTVDLGPAIGQVEAISLRVTRIRDVNGTVWYVRNGEILRVGNLSQNWGLATVDIPIAPSQDAAKALAVLSQVSSDLWADEEFSGVLVEPPEVVGVEAISAESVMLRTSVKTVPMHSARVAREFRHRAKARFDAEGIEGPRVAAPTTSRKPSH